MFHRIVERGANADSAWPWSEEAAAVVAPLHASRGDNRAAAQIISAIESLLDAIESLAPVPDKNLGRSFARTAARFDALHLQAVKTSNAGQLKVADLRFDAETGEFHRDEALLELSPAERRLLTLLMRRSPGLVRHVEIERMFWRNNPPKGDALRAHIYNLRKAVDKPFASKLIHTVHGEGYRLYQRVPTAVDQSGPTIVTSAIAPAEIFP